MGTRYRLRNERSGEIVISKLEMADTFWRRFRGLQFRGPLANGEGLLIVPCRSIHTHWMRFSLDVVMLDSQGSVVAIHPVVKPWRAVLGPPSVHAILEANANSLGNLVALGDRLVTEPFA